MRCRGNWITSHLEAEDNKKTGLTEEHEQIHDQWVPKFSLLKLNQAIRTSLRQPDLLIHNLTNDGTEGTRSYHAHHYEHYKKWTLAWHTLWFIFRVIDGVLLII